MALIYAGTKSAKKQNKKAGWKKEQEEYEAWLKKHGVDTSKKSKSTRAKTSSKVVVSRPVNSSYSQQQALVKSRLAEEKVNREKLLAQKYEVEKVEPKIHDPRVLYKDNPEMLERELKARERKFITAPAFNKGAAMLVTPDMMNDIMTGGGRRRS